MGSLPTVHVPGLTSNSRKTNTLDRCPQCRNASQQIWSRKPESKFASSRLQKGSQRWLLNECLDSLDHSRRSNAAPRDLGNRLLPNENGVNEAISERLAFQVVGRCVPRNGLETSWEAPSRDSRPLPRHAHRGLGTSRCSRPRRHRAEDR